METISAIVEKSRIGEIEKPIQGLSLGIVDLCPKCLPCSTESWFWTNREGPWFFLNVSLGLADMFGEELINNLIRGGLRGILPDQ